MKARRGPLLIAFIFPMTILLGDCVGQETTSEKAPTVDLAKQALLSSPGPQHRELKKLIGDWSVTMVSKGKVVSSQGVAKARMTLGDRFLVVDGDLSMLHRDAKVQFRYSIGYDRRNSEYVLILMDTAGTYPVVARGEPVGTTIRMMGTDKDPVMAEMGIQKKFAFDLRFSDSDSFSLTTIYVDNRTEQEELIPAFEHQFTRATAKSVAAVRPELTKDQKAVIEAGLTRQEAECWTKVAAAAGDFFQLPELHPMDNQEVASAIHIIQNKLLSRPTYRKYLEAAKRAAESHE